MEQFDNHQQLVYHEHAIKNEIFFDEMVMLREAWWVASLWWWKWKWKWWQCYYLYYYDHRHHFHHGVAALHTGTVLIGTVLMSRLLMSEQV